MQILQYLTYHEITLSIEVRINKSGSSDLLGAKLLLAKLWFSELSRLRNGLLNQFQKSRLQIYSILSKVQYNAQLSCRRQSI